MHPQHHSHVLQLDIQGTPQAWISLEHAALHVASDAVAWVDGDGPLVTLRGGFNVARGRQSLLDVHPIMALQVAAPLQVVLVRAGLGRPAIVESVNGFGPQLDLEHLGRAPQEH